MGTNRIIRLLPRFGAAFAIILAGTLNLRSQTSPSTPEAESTRALLKRAITKLGWQPCMVLDSPNQTLEALGASELKYQESKVAFMGPSGGRDLRLADFGTAASAAKALTCWRGFRLKQGFWAEVPKEKRPATTGAATAIAFVGDRAGGAEFYATVGRYLIVAAQRPDGTKAFDQAEKQRIVRSAAKYTSAVLQQLPKTEPLQSPGPTQSTPPAKPTAEPSATTPAPAAPATIPAPSGPPAKSADPEIERARLRQSIALTRARVCAKARRKEEAAFFERHAAYWQHVIEKRLQQAAQQKQEKTP